MALTEDNWKNEIIQAISDFVKIPTVYEEDSVSEDMPYGKKVYKGYEWLKEKALRDGFEVIEYDGHVLALRIKENLSKGRIDVVSHMDVVEPGEGWREDPFSGTITEEYIYGRGTQDMKGALMVTYYALKYIKDHKLPCKREVRIVVGCDEERTMEDIKYYIDKAGEPEFAFTPDGKFPFSLGEKGALMWVLSGTVDSCIESLDGGVQCNVVSPKAVAVVRDLENYDYYQQALSTFKYKGEIEKLSDKLEITIHGKASHASRPEDGINATVQLLHLIASVNQDSLAKLLSDCFKDYNGTGADLDYDIAPMGKLTLNLGMLKIKDKELSAQIDSRYPYGITSDVLTEHIQKVLEPLHVTLKYDERPTLADINSPFIKELLHTYCEISKDKDAQPFISGGVTYCKVIGNCVAFGPMTEQDKELAHQANEVISINRIEFLFQIYKESILRLANL